jgi:hypothetical protein
LPPRWHVAAAHNARVASQHIRLQPRRAAPIPSSVPRETLLPIKRCLTLARLFAVSRAKK